MSPLGSGDCHLKEVHLQTEYIHGLNLVTDILVYTDQTSNLDLIFLLSRPITPDYLFSQIRSLIPAA